MRFDGGWPMGRRKTVQFLVLMTLLAWATQTLMAQWARGEGLVEPAKEAFVPGSPRFAAGGTLEIRGEAAVIGAEVKLKQIARWADADAAVFAPIQDLVIARLDRGAPFRGITLDEIKSTLHDAGVNLAVIRFAGPTSCTVTRSDGEGDRREALEQWIAARQAKREESTTRPAELKAEAQPARAEEPAAGTLRRVLVDDLAERLGLAAEALQVTFKAGDEKVLNLAGPHFKFQVEGKKVRNLGEVAWDVTIVTEGGERKVAVGGVARAWQRQVVAVRPVAFKQLIRAEDVQERRALVDRLSDEAVLGLSQVVGQQAGREVKPGAVFTGKMVEAVPLVRPGQLVTVLLKQGGVQIKSVGRAVDTGAFGQTIRVKSESTKDVWSVVVTGAQTARMGEGEAATANVGSGQ